MDASNLAKEERIACSPNLRNAMPLNGFRPLSTPGAPGLNPRHELVQLARKLALSPEGIDGARFEASFANGYGPDFGAPAKASRRMVGLHYLKYTFNESDESVPSRLRAGVGRRAENPYGQSFCGDTHLQDEWRRVAIARGAQPINPVRLQSGARSDHRSGGRRVGGLPGRGRCGRARRGSRSRTTRPSLRRYGW